MSKILIALAPSMLMACIARDTVGHNERADVDTGEDQLRTLTLASGLSVDVRGDGSALDALPSPLTGAELCQHFSLSITTTFDAALTPLSYAATAILRGNFERSFIEDVALEELLQPLFPNHDQSQWSRLGGFAINPFAVFPYQLSSAAFPYLLGIFDQDAVAPLAVFYYGDESADYAAFPSIWLDPTDIVAPPNVQVWSRVMDSANLLSCPGYSEAVTAAMNMRYVEELASCGDIMAVAYSLPGPGQRIDNGAACIDPPFGYGVTLYPLRRNEWQTVECPRPADAGSEYECFTQTAP